MKPNKKLLILIISIFIALSFPMNATAADNEFTATLQVSPTTVSAGATVTSTILVTNLDTTYGADVNIFYNGGYITSFYLGAGKQHVINHNIVINEDTNVFYTVNASHGPDIHNTELTNTVHVVIFEPTTPTPEQSVTTDTPTDIPTPTPTATINIPVTPTATLVAPEATGIDEPSNIVLSDDTKGWGAFVTAPHQPMQVFGSLYGTNLFAWLGINKDTKDISDDTSSISYINEQNANNKVYSIRRWLFAMMSLMIILSVILSVILIKKYVKKSNSENS
ncbi:MAG: hypothetical protein KAQ68_00285 [Clostridiales bacterium]|nr:hypothetical protein [Clostridiales bacterium]